MKVLLATDGSRSAGEAERLVGSLGWPAGSLIEAVRVDEHSAKTANIFGDAHAAVSEQWRREADAQLAQVKAALVRPGRAVETVLLTGRPASVIVDEAEHIAAGLIVMGSRGQAPIESMLLGSVAAEVIDHASCPVLIARHGSVSGIVLADDGSANAREAADTIAGWPILRGCPVQVVSVADLAPLFNASANASGMSGVAWSPELMDALVKDQERVAREGAARLAERGMAATAKVRSGYVAQELMNAAADANADLIVVGSHGHTGLQRALLGSISRNVVFHARCSVLVVRTAPAR